MKRILFIVLISLLIYGCKHELERPNWDIDLILPLANTTLDINNITSDTSTVINEDAQGFISLVFQEQLVDMNLDTLIQIDAIADEQTHTLDSASFDNVVISDTATIGETINQIPGGTFLLPDGSNSSIPAIQNIANGDTIDIDASEYFETMTLYKGMLTVEINNGYPTDISNISITLMNSTNQNVVATFFFPLITSGNSLADSVSIGGQTIDENLFGILNNMDINASNGPVLINYSDAIVTTITISDIGITEATAIFPEQQLTETFKEHSFDLKNTQLTEIGIKEGTVTVNVLSTLPNGKMIYNIPSLTKNGMPFTSGDMIIPEATSSNLTSFEFDFEGYVLDLTGKQGRIGGDTINTIYTESYTFIDYTGTLETINHTDSFYSFLEFNLIPEYGKGYLGQDTIEFGGEEIETDLFNLIQSGNMDLESANIKIEVKNYIGADGHLIINNLSSENNTTEVSAIFDNTEIHNIERASLTGSNTINPSYTQINIEADEMLEIFPNKLNTNATFFINPDGQSTIEDFLYPEYPLEASINLEIPLSIITNNLSVMDTTEINISSNIENDMQIEQAYITINNGFPLDANLQLILLDQNNLVIDTLIHNAMINAAPLDINNIAVTSISTTLEIDYKDFENGNKIIASAQFTTQPNDEYLKIYSHYQLEINLSAKTNKLIGK